MAFPLPRGITPPEIAFLAEMEMVTVLPRQRLDGLHLLGGPIEPLIPPRRASIPLWLALILKRQRRANILPPPWLHPESLSFILDIETQRSDYKTALSPGPPLPGQTASTSVPVPQYSPDRRPHYVSPPFLPQNVVSSDQTGDNLDRPPALPYHWMEVANMLLDAASDDLADPDQTRRLLKDLREVRLAKIRAGVDVLDAAAGPGGGVALTGVGAMEAGEGRRFVSGVIDGLRRIGASKEQARREQMAEEIENGIGGTAQVDPDDMEF